MYLSFSNVQVFENNREEFLSAYKEHKDDFVSLITKINECYKKVIDDNKWGKDLIGLIPERIY